MIKFKYPTLITITAPTCSGKSYLLEALVTKLGCERIVSTTDRMPRVDEREGVDYFFITTDRSREMEAEGLFAELVTFNGVRYGVTHKEMESKLAPGLPPPIVILEPNGLEIYRKYCGSKGWQMVTLYVSTPEPVRLQRLTDRTSQEIIRAIYGELGECSMRSLTARIRKIVDTNNKRLKSVLDEERGWGNGMIWDGVLSGEDLDKALTDFQQVVVIRNNRSEIYR
jgi:guanylate kinase